MIAIILRGFLNSLWTVTLSKKKKMEVIIFSITVPAQVIMDPFTTPEMKTSLALSWAWLCRPTHQPWAIKSNKSDWLGGEAWSLGSHVSTWNLTQTKARVEQIKSMKPKHGIQIRWNWSTENNTVNYRRWERWEIKLDLRNRVYSASPRFSQVQLFPPCGTVSTWFSRQEHWRGLPCPPPGDLPDPGIEPASLMSPALASRFLPLAPPGRLFTAWENTNWYLSDKMGGI